MPKFLLEGYVESYGTVKIRNVIEETIAVSEAKAKTNIEYRMKKRCNMIPSSKLNFHGTITKIED